MKFLSASATILSILPLAFGQATKPYCPPKSVSAADQRTVFNEFVDTFYIKKNPIGAFETHIDDSYIQHNPGVLSGKQNAINAFRGFDVSTMKYTVINKGIDANIGWVHYRLDMPGGGQPYAVLDAVRFNGSCIMEHWDVQQQRPANPRNPLAMF